MIANVKVLQTVEISGVLQFRWHYIDVVERGVTARPINCTSETWTIR